jgi:hypothetical protein
MLLQYRDLRDRAVRLMGTAFPRGGAHAASTAFSNTQGGWVAGGGPEWAIPPNWLLRGECLFYGQRFPIGGGSLGQLSGFAVGLFVEQYQCGRGAVGLELQVLIQQH